MNGGILLKKKLIYNIIIKMRFEEYVEKQKRENKFNERKRNYENKDDGDGERNTLCYTFEEKETQLEKSSKLLEYTFNLYKFADYVNKFINNSEENSECNENYFDTEKILRFISSHFDKDFEEVLNFYKYKFAYED